jgi:hypothetical protein
MSQTLAAAARLWMSSLIPFIIVWLEGKKKRERERDTRCDLHMEITNGRLRDD